MASEEPMPRGSDANGLDDTVLGEVEPQASVVAAPAEAHAGGDAPAGAALVDTEPALDDPRGLDRVGATPRARLEARIRGGDVGSLLEGVQALGRYVVLDTLGHGGMGVVLRAFDRELDRPVALKVLHEHLGEQATARLRREAQAMAKLSHPNVVQVYEVGEIEGKTFVAMELVKGQTPREWVKQEPRPDWRACVKMFVQLGEGLAAAHAKGLVHRDFKPGNAIIDDEGRPRVLDFGLARRGDEEDDDEPPSVVQRARTDEHQALPLDQSLTKTGAVLGTPAYMPPEQMMGQEADARSDQFSFCVSLYEIVYGERPFGGDSMMALLGAMHGGMVRPVPKGSKAPAALGTVLLRGLDVDPGKRWPSMEALLEELRRLVAPPLPRWVGMGVGVVLVLATVAGVAFARQSDELSSKDEELTEKEKQLQQQVVALEESERRANERLYEQMGMRAKDASEDEDRELEAVRLAVEAFGGIDSEAGSVPAPVFEGLTHALAGVHDGVALRGHQSPVHAVAVSPDGSRIATAGDPTVRLWDALSGTSLRIFEGHQGTVWAVAFSPDGARLATAGEDQTVRLWDVATGTELDSLRQPHPVRSVAFSPDGLRIATASGDAAWVWHHGTDDVVVPLSGHTGRVRGVAFSPDGEMLVSASEDHTVRVWNAQTGGALRILEGHTDKVFDVAFSADGTRIASGGRDHTARLWHTATGQQQATIEPGDVVYAVAFSPDGTRLATGTFDDGTARLWDVATGREVDRFQHDETVFDVAFSPDGQRLVTGSRDFTARAWELDPRRLDPGIALMTLKHALRVDAVAISADGRRIATGSRDGSARVWDAETGVLLAMLKGHTIDVLDVTFSADGQRLASASWDGSVRVWDTGSGALVQTFVDHTEPVHAVRFSPDGTRVLTGSRDGTARVREVATGETMRVASHGSPVVDALFAPDGERLLTVGADGTVKQWSVGTGETLAGPPLEGPVTAVAFSRDGTRIGAALVDHRVRVWSAGSGEELSTFEGHSAAVRVVTFSPDGERLATGSEDGSSRVWDLATGELLTSLPHDGAVSRVAFSPDGEHLVTTSGDHVARRWSLRPQAWHAWGCIVLEDRRGRTEATAQACSKATALSSPTPSTPRTEPVVSTPEAARPMPETITVHGVELVLVPGGTFTMGSPPTERERDGDEGPQHEVTLSSFYLARTEVTNAQYALYLEANPNVPKPPVWGDERYDQPEQPVITLSWDEAKAYCNWAGLVLPTEAQWEYAARAGTTTAYWFGDDAKDLERFGWYGVSTGHKERAFQGARAHVAGTKGTNPFGLFDITGNVWEWTLDVYGSYETSPRAGDGLRHEPVGDAYRVFRGGSWYGTARAARSAIRYSLAPGVRFDDIGLRPAQGIP